MDGIGVKMKNEFRMDLKEREDLAEIKKKSEDDFEKNITYLSAGTLLLSLTFIEKIVTLSKSGFLWTLIASWIILAITLLANLISHQLSSDFHNKTIEELDHGADGLIEKIKKRNGVMRKLNWGTIFGLTIGIGFLIIFCSLNAYKMSNQPENAIKPQGEDILQKGRTITAPSSLAKPSSNENVNPQPLNQPPANQDSNSGQQTDEGKK